MKLLHLALICTLALAASVHASPPDQTATLQTLLNPKSPSQTITLPRGVWPYNNLLHISTPGTTINGAGAVLLATNPSRSALVVLGNGVTVKNLTFATLKPTTRNTMPASVRILLRGSGATIISNTIMGGAGGGIMLLGAQSSTIIGNQVFNTLADGIHATGGSQDATISHNLVNNSGDDGIAVVSYGNEPSPTTNITITSNSVANLAWGRGITTIGGSSVTIADNTIRNITCCAGIKVAQDGYYKTHNAHHIAVTGNTISHIQTGSPPAKTGRYTHHAGIDINASNGGQVSHITISSNTIHHTRFAGIRLMGHVCQTAITNNQFTHIGYTPILLTQSQCPQNPITTIKNNLLEKTPITTPTLQKPNH
ncbi:MAG: hypothetical protein EBQ80_05590 [Proteobacteria bacterium]|nr:hypothetical protein [Pseudomonadota bacterium]